MRFIGWDDCSRKMLLSSLLYFEIYVKLALSCPGCPSSWARHFLFLFFDPSPLLENLRGVRCNLSDGTIVAENLRDIKAVILLFFRYLLPWSLTALYASSFNINLISCILPNSCFFDYPPRNATDLILIRSPNRLPAHIPHSQAIGGRPNLAGPLGGRRDFQSVTARIGSYLFYTQRQERLPEMHDVEA